jgi:hypothetical protein
MTFTQKAVEAADITSHPAYFEGFYDALDFTPLFNDATEEYAAGWHAAWRCKELLSAANDGEERFSPLAGTGE